MYVGNIKMAERLPYRFMERMKIGGWLYYEILSQLGINEDEFKNWLKKK